MCPMGTHIQDVPLALRSSVDYRDYTDPEQLCRVPRFLGGFKFFNP